MLATKEAIIAPEWARERYIRSTMPVLWLPLYRKGFNQSAELLTNTGFETGDPPTGWSAAGASWVRSNEQAKAGTYSGKLTRAGVNCQAYQLYYGHVKYRGLRAILGDWVYATVANRARTTIGDGIGNTHSSYHSGSSSWEWLTTTRTIDAASSNIGAYMKVDNADVSAYFDEATMYIPDLCMSADAYGHICQNNGSLYALMGRQFDAVLDDYINLGIPSSLHFTSQPFSGAVWVKFDALTANHRIITKGLSNTDGWVWYVTTTGILAFETDQAAANQTSASKAGSIVTGVWYHLAFSRNGASVRMYRNGVDITSSPTGHTNPADNSARPFWIGHSTASLNGQVREARIWARPLSGVEVMQDFLETRF